MHPDRVRAVQLVQPDARSKIRGRLLTKGLASRMNTTLTGLSYGTHNLTVYAVDVAGNTGTSKTVYFTISEPEQTPEPFPVVLVATASGASAAIIGLGLLVYFKRRRR